MWRCVCVEFFFNKVLRKKLLYVTFFVLCDRCASLLFFLRNCYASLFFLRNCYAATSFFFVLFFAENWSRFFFWGGWEFSHLKEMCQEC